MKSIFKLTSIWFFLFLPISGKCQIDSWHYSWLSLNGDSFHSFTSYPAVAEGLEGEIFVAGEIQGVYKRDILITCLNKKGEILWCKQFILAGIQYVARVELEIQPNGNLFVAWSGSNYSAGVFSIDSEGELLWSKLFQDGEYQIRSALLDGQKLILAGSLNHEPFSACIDDTGQLHWATILEDGYPPEDQLSAWNGVFKGLDGKYLFVGHLGYFMNTSTGIPNSSHESLIGAFGNDGQAEWLLKGSYEYPQFAYQTADNRWIIATNRDGFYTGGLIFQLNPDKTVGWAKTVSPEEAQGSGIYGLLGTNNGRMLLSFSRRGYYPDVDFGKVTWAWLDSTGNFTGARSIRESYGQFIMNQWRFTKNENILACGSITPLAFASAPFLTILRFSPDSELMLCCSESDSIIGMDVPVLFEDYSGAFSQTYTWVDLEIKEIEKIPTLKTVCGESPQYSIIASDTLLCVGECVHFQVDTEIFSNDLQHRWHFPGGEPEFAEGAGPHTVCFDAPSRITVEMYAPGGCLLGSDTAFVALRGELTPNAFTPNGDQTNDTFRPVVFCEVEQFFFAVYSRWGEKVFETRDPKQAWDGRIGNENAPSDVYVWLLEYSYSKFGVPRFVKRKGEITLIR